MSQFSSREPEEPDNDDSSNIFLSRETKLQKIENELKQLYSTKAFAETTKNDGYEKAKRFYMKGMLYESSGLINEALNYYRKATQLNSEIDIYMSKFWKSIQNTSELGNFVDLSVNDGETSKVIEALYHNKTSCTLLKLPKELLSKIVYYVIFHHGVKYFEILSKVSIMLRPIVSDDQLWHKIFVSQMGPAITNQIALKTTDEKDILWKTFLKNTPMPRFDGWYISKASYWRYGQNDGIIDDSSLPCYSITYYRYLKFFKPHNHGILYENLSLEKTTNNNNKNKERLKNRVLMLNCLEAPSLMLPKLLILAEYIETNRCNINEQQWAHLVSQFQLSNLLVGNYYLMDDPAMDLTTCSSPQNINTSLLFQADISYCNSNEAVMENGFSNLIHIVFTKKSPGAYMPQPTSNYGRRQSRTANAHVTTYNYSTYDLQFSLLPNGRRQPNRRLQWKNYSLDIKYGNGNKTKTIFDLCQEKYPPLNFISEYHYQQIQRKQKS